MVIEPGYYNGPDRSQFFRDMREHFRRRGVTSERKIGKLVHRWIRQKGYRLPNA